MNRYIMVFIVALNVISVFGQGHPFLFMNSNDIARVQANAVFDAHFAGLAQDQINRALGVVPGDLPPFDTSWWAEEQAKGYLGANRSVTYEHLRLVPQEYSNDAKACTRAWVLTGDTNFLQTAKTVLLMQSAYDFGYEDANSGLDYAISTRGTMEAYDMAYNQFSPAEHVVMEDFFMRLLYAVEACDDYWVANNPSGAPMNNHEGWHRACMAMVGFFYDLQPYIDRAISDSKGFYDMLRDGFLDEGLWLEASLPYHYVQLEAMLFTAERAYHAGYPVDLYTHTVAGRSLQSCFDTVFDLTFPSGLLPAIGDGYGSMFYPGGYKEYELLYTRLQDSKCPWLINQTNQRDRDSLFWGIADLPAGSAPAGSSRLWPEHGYAALRMDEGSTYWNGAGWTLFSSFHNTHSHEHADKLSIMLYAKDHLWIRDSEADPDGEVSSADITLVLNRSTTAHNAVMIDWSDQRKTLPRPLELLEYSIAPTEKRITTGDSASLLYPGVNQLRTCIVRDDYVVDVFQVKADQLREISWTTHINATPYDIFGSTFSPANLPTTGPWQFIMADDVSAPTNRFWETFSHAGKYFRMDVATDRPAQYTRCRFPLKEATPQWDNLPMRMIGGQETNLLFVAVYRTEDQAITDPVEIEIGTAPDGHDWPLKIISQGVTNTFTIRGLASPVQTTPTSPYTDNANTLVLHHFDNTSFLDDDSANPGRNRNLYTGVPLPTLAPSMPDFGNAAVFNGSTSRGHISNTANVMPTDNVRYEFWAKNATKKNNDSWQTVFLDAWDLHFKIQDRSSGDWRIDIEVYDSNNVKEAAIVGTDQNWGFNMNDWNHYAVEVQNDTLRLIVNGNPVATATGFGALNSGNRNIDLGTDYNGGNPWAGMMDEFRISTLGSPPPYDVWLAQYPGVGIQTDMLADPDGDGRNNLQEWGFGGNPTFITDIGYVPTLGTVEYLGDTWLEYVYARHDDAASLGLSYFLEENTALTNSAGWGSASLDVAEGVPGSAGSGFTAVTNWLNMDASADKALFLRLMLEAD